MSTTHKFDTQVDKVLQLVIHSLYTNSDIFLRELISNSSDACEKLRYQLLSNVSNDNLDATFGIDVKFSQKEKYIEIIDNGIGMDKEDLKNNLGTIAKSGSSEFIEQLLQNKQENVEIIGQFGVGFYSAFIVADRVTVISKKAETDQAYLWSSEGKDSFAIEEVSDEMSHGTKIRLHIKEGSEEYLDYYKLNNIIELYSNNITFPITLYNLDEDTSNQINKGKSLWNKSPNSVTEEEYNEFYRSISYLPNEPWKVIHTHADGGVQYNALLFVPSSKPFDLFNPERKTQIKLYIKKVFINEGDIGLLPNWLRFIKGVVDSNDLPLNISRETLQHNAALNKISKALIRKILSELETIGKKDAEKFLTFWENFGSVLKEGLCEQGTDQEKILSICRFKTNKSNGKYISLEDYQEDEIYFITGNNENTLLSSPQIEGFNSKGIEVLILTDSVDDFWVTTVNEYKGKKFTSVLNADIDLTKDADDQAEEGKSQQNAASDDDIELVSNKFKSVLEGRISEVRKSTKLTTSPVCLASTMAGLSIRMERFLVENNQLGNSSPRVLEVNFNHPIIQYIQDHIDDSKSAKVIELLYNQACVIEGEDIPDPVEFAKNINNLIENYLGVK